jgi:hypothetical protein
MNFYRILASGLLLVLSACTTAKYNIGDCVDMTVMHVDDEMNWDSSGHELGEFKIVGRKYTNRVNRYMNSRLHSNHFYLIKLINHDTRTVGKETYVIPVEDLDQFRYASVFWEIEAEGPLGCNSYD